MQSEDKQGHNLDWKIVPIWRCTSSPLTAISPARRLTDPSAVMHPHVLPGDPSSTLRSCLEFVSTAGLQITLKVLSNVLYKSTGILMYMSLSTSIQLTKGWFGWRDSFYIENGWQSNHCGLCDYILDFLKWFRVECLIALVVQNLTACITWGKIFTSMAKKI